MECFLTVLLSIKNICPMWRETALQFIYYILKWIVIFYALEKVLNKALAENKEWNTLKLAGGSKLLVNIIAKWRFVNNPLPTFSSCQWPEFPFFNCQQDGTSPKAVMACRKLYTKKTPNKLLWQLNEKVNESLYLTAINECFASFLVKTQNPGVLLWIVFSKKDKQIFVVPSTSGSYF